MKSTLFSLLLLLTLLNPLPATTITIVHIYEPLSLHGTDGDDVIVDTGEALQATVLSRPMALTGAFPEVLIDAIRSTHRIPTNNPNYQVLETNLLILCGLHITAEMTEDGLLVILDLTDLTIPEEVDLTSRQLIKLVQVAVRRTLEEYQRPQPSELKVTFKIIGTTENNASLLDLQAAFTLGANP